jgi:hypothetical protein
MLLALLILVVGRLGGWLGGPPGGPVALVLDTERAMGTAPPMLSIEGLFSSPGIERGGGMPPIAIGGGGVPLDMGGGVPEADLGPALGGGGVADLASTFSAPGFLLIHRLSSGS